MIKLISNPMRGLWRTKEHTGKGPRYSIDTETRGRKNPRGKQEPYKRNVNSHTFPYQQNLPYLAAPRESITYRLPTVFFSLGTSFYVRTVTQADRGHAFDRLFSGLPCLRVLMEVPKNRGGQLYFFGFTHMYSIDLCACNINISYYIGC